MRRHHRRAQVLFVLAVLGEHHFHPHEVLAQAVGFAERLLVVVSDSRQERRDLDGVEAAHRFPEALLSQIERAYIHTWSSPLALIGCTVWLR